jgi:nitroreductase
MPRNHATCRARSVAGRGRGFAPPVAARRGRVGWRVTLPTHMRRPTSAPVSGPAATAAITDTSFEPSKQEDPVEPALGTWEAIDSVRAVRTFSDTEIPETALARILDAGRRAGSSKNLQRWAFVVCRDRVRLSELATLGPWAGHLAGAAIAVALITPDPHAPGTPLSVMFDLGRAAQNMVLAAWELSIGSVPATVYDQPKARALLGLPADRHCEYLLSFGYPAAPAVLDAPNRPGGRLPLSAVVHVERW